jgi:GT2 family glycosyltransferase
MRGIHRRFRTWQSNGLIARATGLLDADWYQRRYPDVVASGLTAAEHFSRHGFFEGRDPNPLFNTDWYRHHHDVASDRNCLQHYLVEGHRVGLEPSVYFDSEWYGSRAGRLDADRSPLEHYWSVGWRHCHDPHPLFDSVWYLGQRPRGLSVGTVPYVHFLSYGVHEGLSPSPLFDPNAYLDLNSDVARVGAEPFTHFLSWGRHEGRLTSELVDSDFYKLQYPDDLLVHKWGSEAHFARFGWSENRHISRDPLANRIMRFVAEQASTSRRFATSKEFGVTSLDPIDWVARADAIVVRGYENPRVSIIIPTLDHADDVIRCVESISRLPDTTPFRVVVVDDGSSEDQHRLLARLRGVDLVRMEKNTGFAGACNAGIELGSSEFILLLNNDTEVLPGWLDALVAEMDTNPSTGIAGSMVLRADCRLQEAGGIVWSDGTGAHVASGEWPTRGVARYRRPVDFCSGASLLVRRSLWDSVGGFDDQLAPAYYEDVDLCFSARGQGFETVYRPDSVILHREGSSHGRGSFGVKRRQYVNREKFLKKWAIELSTHESPRSVEDWQSLTARDRRRTRHVLVCDQEQLDPTADAGSVRMDAIVRGLVDLDCVVHFHPSGFFRSPDWVDSIARYGVNVLVSMSNLEGFLVSHRDQLDFILVSRPSVMGEVASAITLHAPQVPLIYDMVDAHGLRLSRKAAISGSPEDLRNSRHIEAVERRSSRLADITVAVSRAEVDHISSVSGINVTSLVIPTIHKAVPNIPGFEGREGILFVGGFQHDPNVDAAVYLVGEILPRVSAKIGPIPVTIVGSRPRPEVLELASETVRVLGWIADLTPEYARHRMVVAPLRYGAGVKGKIGEALSHGVPIVTTPIGVEGYDVVHGRDILVGESTDDLVDAIVQNYDNAVAWSGLSENGALSVERTAGEPALQSLLRQLIDLARTVRRT